VHNKMKENLNEKLANKLFEEKELNKKWIIQTAK
jgi:hypothetical protein